MPAGKKLPLKAYRSRDVVTFARDLLGKVLMTNVDGVCTGGVIVETEAYGGPDDRASHAYGGRRTSRTESMFLPGGHAYVYLCYGMYELFNVVTGPADEGFAVLIRGLEPTEGIPHILRRRKAARLARKVCGGPGALAMALGITRGMDREKLSGGRVWIEDRGITVPDTGVIASPRVGVNYAGEAAAFPWRFRVKDSGWTSPAK